MNEIDARNQECPVPVLMTRELVDKQNPARVTVIVSNDASRQNVCRFLKSKGYLVDDDQVGDDFHITAVCEQTGADDASDVQAASTPTPVYGSETGKHKILVMITTDRIGYGDDSLGLKLMANFVKTLKEFGSDLWRVVFVNNGVKLTVESSELMSVLVDLENSGIKLMVCGTCLEHYGISEMKRAGETTNMLDIITAMHLANKVITM